LPWVIQPNERREDCRVSLTILYHNPERPDEGGLAVIIGQPEAAGVMAQLEKRGFIVDKITFKPSKLDAAVNAPSRSVTPGSS
jgi:hypothetical protein